MVEKSYARIWTIAERRGDKPRERWSRPGAAYPSILRPAAIIRDLDLLRPIYAQTAAYGHFGREEPDFSWERADRAEALRSAIRA
jgi:hypothetical protein